MRTITNSMIALIVIALTVAAAFGQQARMTGVRTRPLTAMPVGSVTAANANSYFTGYDFQYAAHLVAAGKTREALAQMAFLWDELSGQPEVPQIEDLMRLLIRGAGTRLQAVQKLELAQAAVEARLRGDRRWFYDVGKTYSQMFIAASDMLDSPDLRVFRLKLAALGVLARTAPAGTPAEFVSALAKLGEFGSKDTMSDQDVNAMAVLWETIDKTFSA